MHESRAQVCDVANVSMKAFEVVRKTTVAKNSVCVIVRSDSQFPIIVCPSWWATEDEQWTMTIVSDVKGEKVSFHRVVLVALRSTASELDGTAIDWERKAKVTGLQQSRSSRLTRAATTTTRMPRWTEMISLPK